MSDWNTDRARHTYSIAHWSEGYVDVDEQGRVLMRPRGAHGVAVALPEVVRAAEDSGLKLPILLRFVDILADKRARMQQAFARAQNLSLFKYI